jgi:hypothetical protein
VYRGGVLSKRELTLLSQLTIAAMQAATSGVLKKDFGNIANLPLSFPRTLAVTSANASKQFRLGSARRRALEMRELNGSISPYVDMKQIPETRRERRSLAELEVLSPNS